MKFILLFILMIFSRIVFAQSSYIEILNDSAGGINWICKKSSANELLITGNEFATSQPIFSKIDQYGNVIFSKYYTSPDHFTIYDLLETQNEYLLFCTAQTNSMTIIHTNFQGNIISANSYAGAYQFEVKGSIRYPDGSITLASTIKNVSNNNYDLLIFKIDSTGSILWKKRYANPRFSVLSKLINFGQDGFYLFGILSDSTTLLSITKCDTSGIVLWSKIYDTPSNNYPYADKTHDGQLIVSSSVPSSTSLNSYMLKLDTSGHVIWSKEYTDYLSFQTRDIKTVFNDGFIITGCLDNQYGFSMRTDTNGNIKWARKYYGYWYDELNAVVVTNDSGFAFAGRSNGYYSNDLKSRGSLIKTDSDGHVPCFESTISIDTITRIITEYPDTFISVFANVHASTVSLPVEYADYGRAVCPAIVSIEKIEGENFSIYPNPASTGFILKSEIQNGDFNIFDSVGKLIFKTKISSMEEKINSSTFEDGVYFFTFSDTKQIFRGKIIVQH